MDRRKVDAARDRWALRLMDVIEAFLETAGWGAARREAMTGDASARRYERLTSANGDTAILMDARAQGGESLGSFLHIAEFLRGIGLSAPKILAKNENARLLLLEDLGDRLFAREVVEDPSCEPDLYLRAADVLTALHRVEPPTSVARFDAAAMASAIDVAFDWYLAGATGSEAAHRREDTANRLFAALKVLDGGREVLIHRDYHAENLLWLPERNGIARVGLIDFQDAVRGHPAYDLVSLLQDARRDVPDEVVAQTTEHFIGMNANDPAEISTATALLGFQRSLRILGVFARLCLRDGKTHYVDLIPRVWAHIETNLAHPALASLVPVCTQVLPEPTDDVLSRLKEQGGQWTGR